MSSAFDLCPTGIQGLDDLLQGGVPQGWSVVVPGSPGAGKTSLLTEFLIRGIQDFDDPGVIVTFNESRRELVQIMAQFGWDLPSLEEEQKLVVVDLSYGKILGRGEFALEGGKADMSGIIRLIKGAIDRVKARRLAMDPITAFNLIFEDPRDIRFALLRFFGVMRSFNLTTLAAKEQIEVSGSLFSVEEFLAHGVIRLYNERRGEGGWGRKRGLEVVKMRGVNHQRGIYPFSITSKGFRVLPESREL